MDDKTFFFLELLVFLDPDSIPELLFETGKIALDNQKVPVSLLTSSRGPSKSQTTPKRTRKSKAAKKAREIAETTASHMPLRSFLKRYHSTGEV